jgi:predicted DsbA family dithiol-disulfide isomerase
LVEAVWLPFELHPEVPAEGIPRDEYFPPAYRARIDANLRMMSAEAGLVMKPRDRLINTRAALATAEFARDNGAFDAVHRALFKAHWEGTAKLESVADLRRIAEGAGLDGDELEAALDEGRYEDLLDANRREATQVGIDAIPAHVFGRKFLVVGAHPYELFKQVVDRVQASEGPA